KQNSDPIYIEWDNNSSATTNLLVPERINDAAGNTLLSFNNTTVNNSGIITRVPLTVTDYEGRKVQYEYDSDRLTKRIDPLGNEWLYQYQDYRPERAPQAVLKRLHTIKDPEGHSTKFHYEPATALISGFDLPSGGGFNREVSMRTNEFGQKEKTESKVFQSGRREDKVYLYGEPLEIPSTVPTQQATDSIEFGTASGSATPGQEEKRKQPNWRWVYVSYGSIASMSEATMVMVGRSNIGGAAIQLGFANGEVVDEGNGSTRMLDRVLVNGEAIYSTKKRFANSGGTHI